MKIIAGLGNPGREYANTRHNLGFMVVDEIARRLPPVERRNRFRAEVLEIFASGEKIILVKPQTYMNLSGASVREAMRWYRVPLEETLVIADDIDLPFGAIRMRASGGSGGHNGLKSIIAEIGGDAFPRLRMGIGRGRGEAVRQVLGRFNPEEERLLPEFVGAAADCALAWCSEGIVTAMNRCNRRPEPAGEAEPGRGATSTGPAESRRPHVQSGE
ncbi:MAG: aminoacyl-tRNA hydrolase [Thermomicrobiales bacterium]|nr:aminoacyl-tRNA hydrolase [Thermomicrobiales bacterium]